MDPDKYRNKLILAPMVRYGTLPSRLLSLKYGADLVYSEELIDHLLLKSRRVYNERLGCVDIIDDMGKLVFRTCDIERDRVVMQIGTSDAERALKCSRLVEDSVSAIDINMGCPKGFSIKGGMGAALLSTPGKIKQILETLVANLSIPVTCKIRCLGSLENTLELAEMIEKTGVSAIAIHGRTKDERPNEPNRNHYIREVKRVLSIPVIANGGSLEISTHEDIFKFKENTGADSVMLARRAQRNPSIFRPGPLVDKYTLGNEYLKIYRKWGDDVYNLKYNLGCIGVQPFIDHLRSLEEFDNVVFTPSVKYKKYGMIMS